MLDIIYWYVLKMTQLGIVGSNFIGNDWLLAWLAMCGYVNGI